MTSKQRIRAKVWPLLVLASFLAWTGTAAELRVAAGNPAAAEPYDTWANAAATIQAAVDYAQENDIIRVTNGVYAVGGRTATGASLTNRVARVKQACDRADIRFWGEYEIFDFGERREYLLPAGIERLRNQLPGLSRLAEKIVVCGVPGLMEDPGAQRPLGSERAFRLFRDYFAEGSHDAANS